MSKTTYRREYVKCGKAGCKKCPHGPYWYAYWHEGKRLRKKYLGKKFRPEGDTEGPPPSVNRLDDILNRRTASLALAKEILGISGPVERRTAKKAYWELALIHHPDRGGDKAIFVRIQAAWEYIEDFLASEETYGK